MIRKAIHFRHAPSLEMCQYSSAGWDETEEIEIDGERISVWKDILYEGDGHRPLRFGGRIRSNYFVPIRFFRKRPNKMAREMVASDGTIWFTLPERVTAHSRTNMAYGVTRQHKDGTRSSKTYWAEDGSVFSTSRRYTPNPV
jgi:hypothetical protein